MAWRDSRRDRRRLLLFISVMTIGVAALVAIGSFGANLQQAVRDQSRAMFGADFRVRSRQPFSEETNRLLEEQIRSDLVIGQATQVSFSSMAFFPASEDTRLVQVRAIEGDFPFYGDLVTEPAAAAREFRNGRRALVDAAVLVQFGIGTGDVVRIGSIDYEVAGALNKIPGESATTAMFGPRIFIPLEHLDPELTVRGSRVTYMRYYQLEPAVDTEAVRDSLETHARANRLRLDDVQTFRNRLGRAMLNLRRFLGLVAFFALILGGLGVGSAIHVHIRRKIETVATLRCLGATAWQTFSIYLVQALVLGSIGALAGALMGLAIQRALPVVISDFLPMDVPLFVSWSAVIKGVCIGLSITLAFALLPLVPIRRISPFSAIRSTVEPPRAHDPMRYAIMLAIGLGVLLYAWLHTRSIGAALGYAGGLFAAFGLLALTAIAIRFGARRLLPRRWPFEWRQGMSNLYRPGNQTLLLMVCIGIASFDVMTLFQTRTLLLNELSFTTSGEEPNLVLFDIQSDQLEDLCSVVEEEGLTIMDRIPIVNMRVHSVKGRRATELVEDKDDDVSTWAVTREYRSSYRQDLGSEDVLEGGSWTGTADPADGPVPISLEEGIAESLGLELGDEMVWNVQGATVPTRLASLRTVDWLQMRPNFFALFPAGVLEEAPQFFVVTTRGDSAEEIGLLQRAVVKQFPNISAIDITLVLDVAQDLLARVGFVIRFMALFEILTGLLVLVCSVLTSRYQRLEEGVLLRTLGATRPQVVKIMNVEYFILGALAVLTGLLLSIGGTWALATFLFDAGFTVAVLPLATAFVVITLLVLLIGRIGNRGLHSRPPLEVLRTEAQ